MVRPAGRPSMRIAAIYFRLHGYLAFVCLAVGFGCLAFALAKVPLPQAAEQTYGDYTQLTAFHILPLLLAPAASFALVGSVSVPRREQHASRQIFALRLGLLLGLTAISIIGLSPAAVSVGSGDVGNAIPATLENVLLVIGVVAFLIRWIDPAWCWFPIVAVGAAGLVAADHSAISTLTVIDRTPGDMRVAIVAWSIGLIHYAFRGARVVDADTHTD